MLRRAASPTAILVSRRIVDSCELAEVARKSGTIVEAKRARGAVRWWPMRRIRRRASSCQSTSAATSVPALKLTVVGPSPGWATTERPGLHRGGRSRRSR